MILISQFSSGEMKGVYEYMEGCMEHIVNVTLLTQETHKRNKSV